MHIPNDLPPGSSTPDSFTQDRIDVPSPDTHPNDHPSPIPIITLARELPIDSTSQPNSAHLVVTRSQTRNSKPKSFPDFKVFYSTKHPLQVLSSVLTDSETEPSSYSQATSSPQWHAAMGREFEALMQNGTWYLCPKPLNHNIVRNKWVYKIKRNPDGSIERLKA